MKKLVSFVLILSMLCSVLVVPVFAAGSTTYKRGDVLYEQDFTNFDVASAKPYGYAAGNGGALQNFEVVDGALRINTSNLGSDGKALGGRYGTRLELYAIPDDVMRYSIEMDLYIDAYHSTTKNSYGPGLLMADNGITDTTASEKLSEFSMFWLRYTNLGTTGSYTYGGEASQNVVSKAEPGFCEAGTWYHLEIYIDRSDEANRWGTFRATNKTTGSIYTAEGFTFNPLAHKAIVGLYNSGTDTKYDNIKVSYGDAYFGNEEPAKDTGWGTNVLYEQDFTNFDVASAKPYGYAAGNGGALQNFELVDGALRINSFNLDANGKAIGGRYGTRLELYTIPEDVTNYSIEMDMFIDAYHNTSASQGPGMLIADNGITDASTSEKLSEFSMFWFRYTNKANTGTYTYGGEASQNVVSKAEPGFCEAGTWYHLEIYIDNTDVANRWGTFRATNKTTGTTYTAEGFPFNPLSHKEIVGLYSNGTDAKFDNVKVTYGDAYFGNKAPGTDTGASDEPEAPLDLTSPAAPAVNAADVLYSQDFSSYNALLETIYGYGGVNGALKTYDVTNGILHFNSSKIDSVGKSLGGRYGSRVKLYEVPDDVKQFSVSLDMYINKYGGETASFGPGLLIADNGITDDSASATLAEFSMIWLRQFGIGTSGAYTYGDTSLNVVSSTEPGICVPGGWYRVQVYVDNSNALDPCGVFRITNLETKEVYETDYFSYNVCGHDPIVGLYNNGTDIYVDNVYVTKGNTFLTDLSIVEINTEPIQTTTQAPESETEPVESTPAVTETIAPETSVTEPGDTTEDPTEPAGGISPIVIVVVAVVLIGGCVACFFLIKDNKIKYIIIAVIAVALVVFVIIASTAGGKQTDDGTTPGADGTDNVTTTAQGGEVGAEDTTVPAETELQHNLPELPELNGEVINILSWKEEERDEFNAEAQNGDLFNDAKYSRNLQIMEMYGVTFDVNREVAGNSTNTDNYIAYLTNSVNSGSKEFDIIAGYSQAMASLVPKGLLLDMMEYEHLDFEREWWSKYMVEGFTINDKLYICSGDVAPSSLFNMYGVFFNKEMIEEFKLENPYELVNSGKWTLDKMIEMSTGIYSDLNGNGVKDIGDRYGLSIYYLHYDPFFYGAGSMVVERDDGGNLMLSPKMASERTLSVIERLCTLIHDSNDGIQVTHAEAVTDFAEGRSLFDVNASRDVPGFMNDDLSFGILPMPKYDEAQEDYVSLFRYVMSYLGIPVDAVDPDASAAMIQALAFYSYKDIVPAVYEQTLKLKYSDSGDDAVMYDIIRRTQCYDIGRLFNKTLSNGATANVFRNAINNNNLRWISTIRSYQSAWVKAIQDLQEACDD